MRGLSPLFFDDSEELSAEDAESRYFIQVHEDLIYDYLKIMLILRFFYANY